MKIRTGFVSNSSSSSFAIAVTRDMELTEEQKCAIMESYIAECKCYEQECNQNPTPEERNKIIKEGISILCQNDGCFWGEDEHQNLLAWAIGNVLPSICAFETGPGGGQMENIFADQNKEKNIDKLKNILGSLE